jgi:hypothetical protein
MPGGGRDGSCSASSSDAAGSGCHTGRAADGVLAARATRCGDGRHSDGGCDDAEDRDRGGSDGGVGRDFSGGGSDIGCVRPSDGGGSKGLVGRDSSGGGSKGLVGRDSSGGGSRGFVGRDSSGGGSRGFVGRDSSGGGSDTEGVRSGACERGDSDDLDARVTPEIDGSAGCAGSMRTRAPIASSARA